MLGVSPSPRITITSEYTANVASTSRPKLLEWWRANKETSFNNMVVADRNDSAPHTCQLRVRLEHQNAHIKISQILEMAGISTSVPHVHKPYSKELVLKNLDETYTIDGKNYQVLREISSRGCYGDVFLAKDLESGQRVAIKVLRVEGDREDVMMKHMRYKGSHPNIVEYIGSGQVMEKTWIVMEYLDGEMLGRYLRDKGEWTPGMTEQKRSAENFMYRVGVNTERENDRDNIMVLKDSEGNPYLKLIDFGTLSRG